MRFRIWHLLVVMAWVACGAPIAKWLLTLEALDHPQVPQTTLDFVGFYVGSLTLVGVPFVAVVWAIERRLQAGRTPDDNAQRGASASGHPG